MWRCLDDWRGDIALSVEVDAAGKITDVIAEGTDQRMRACVSSRLYDEGSVETYGPGRLYVTYFMGEQG